MSIFKQVDNIVDAVIYGYIFGWENSTKRTKVALHAGRERIASELNIDSKTVTRSLQRLEKLGLVAYKRYPRGIWVTTRKDLVKAWGKAKLIGQNVPSQSEVIGQNVLSTRWDKKSYHAGQNVLSNNISPLPSEGIIYPLAAVRESGGGGEPFESESTANLPAQKPVVIPDTLKGLASQVGPIAERWLFAHVASGTRTDDWRLLAVLRESAAMTSTIRSPKILELKFNDLPEEKPAPNPNAGKPERITTKDGKRVLRDGKWVDAATPYPNQPPLSPPRAAQVTPPPPVRSQPTAEELKAREEAVAARKREMDEARAKQELAAIRQREINEENDRRAAAAAGRAELAKRRSKRTNELLSQGKSLQQCGEICRAEGLFDKELDK